MRLSCQLLLRRGLPCLFLFSFLIPGLYTSAQLLTPKKMSEDITVTGVVKSPTVVLSGASISVKTNPAVGTQTTSEGTYTIKVPANGILVFSMVGFENREIQVNGESVINVELTPLDNKMNEITVVAYGTQKKTSMVSSIETINPKELKIPSSNLTTALAGRLAGVISYQRSGEPGQDNASFFIRGVTTFGYKVDPLILIDGIEVSATDLARIQPDDIASFSIMKDATATSLYGARGANGVILVTTKSGKEGPARISIRLENSFSSNTSNVKMADPITYMKLANEAILTRSTGGENSRLIYSQSKIDNTAAGMNKYVFPANDWMKLLIKDHTTALRLNFNASGGGSIARYYISGTANQDNGILNVDQRNNFNSNIKLKSYQLRSNVNINMTKTTEVIVRLSGNFDDYNGPIDGGSGVYSKIMRSNPVLFPAFYPADLMPKTNHTLFGNDISTFGNRLINPYADMVRGYKDYSRSTLNSQFELKQNLSFIVPGLSARGLFNTTRYSFFDIQRGYSPFYYAAGGYNRLTDQYTLASLNPTEGTEYLSYSPAAGSKDINSMTYVEAAVVYNTTVAKKNDVTGLLVYTRRNQIIANQPTLQESLPFRNQGVSGRFTYSYDNRYMAELNFGYNGSERFYKTQRYGFFPAAGIGWLVSNEAFWIPLEKTISKLKLKATYGLVGNDAIGSPADRFFYLSDVNMSDPNRRYTFGENFGSTINGVRVNRYDNQDITWERSKKLNLGIELGIFHDIQLQVDYFTDHRTNILMTRSSIPTTTGLTNSPRANIGAAKSNGVDVSLDYNRNFSKYLWLQVHGNFTYAHSEFTSYEEPQYNEPYKSHIGKSLAQNFGLIAERLFIDDAEVANSPKQFGEYRAGDIKYRDVNGDGQITSLDEVPLGYPTVPEIIYGFGFSAGYKGFDISTFLQGSARSSFWVDPNATAPFINYYYPGEANLSGSPQNALLQAYADNHWSEDNRNSYALWPRLSTTVIDNNARTNSWFMRNGAFLRLKSVEVGYSFPQTLMRKWHLSTSRIYMSGTNLATISGFKLWDIEMGGNGLGYPIQKVINVGIQIGL